MAIGCVERIDEGTLEPVGHHGTQVDLMDIIRIVILDIYIYICTTIIITIITITTIIIHIYIYNRVLQLYEDDQVIRLLHEEHKWF